MGRAKRESEGPEAKRKPIPEGTPFVFRKTLPARGLFCVWVLRPRIGTEA